MESEKWLRCHVTYEQLGKIEKKKVIHVPIGKKVSNGMKVELICENGEVLRFMEIKKYTVRVDARDILVYLN